MNVWSTLIEATIDSVHLSAIRKTVCIEISDPSGANRRKRIVATGVEDFVADELRLSNIIGNVQCYVGANAQEQNPRIGEDLFFLMRGRGTTPADPEWPPLKEKLNKILSGFLKLLIVEPVYGATIILLAHELKLEELHD